MVDFEDQYDILPIVNRLKPYDSIWKTMFPWVPKVPKNAQTWDPKNL
jgi:hypothetical protein